MPAASVDNAVLELLQSIRADINSIRVQQTALEQQLSELKTQQLRLQEQFEGYNEYRDEYAMDADSYDYSHNDAPLPTTPTDG